MDLIEDAPFLSFILKTSVKIFIQLWVHLSLGTFPGNITKRLKFIVHFLPFLKTVLQYNPTLKSGDSEFIKIICENEFVKGNQI